MVAQTVKHLSAMWETWVQSLGKKDPLEKEMATHSSILPGESHGQRNLAGFHRAAQSETRLKRLSTITLPLHNVPACEFEQTLGDSKDREAWCVAVHEVTKRHD